MTDVRKPSVPRPAAIEWYYERDGAQVGPIAEEAIVRAAQQGDIKSDTLVWHEAQDEWLEAAKIPRLAHIVGPMAEPTKTARTTGAAPQAGTHEIASAMPQPASEHSSTLVDAATAPTPEAEPVSDDSPRHLDLEDAVPDEEDTESTIDPAQVRQILERTSRYPSAPTTRFHSEYPNRFPSERWIPPASVATNPPPPEPELRSSLALRLGKIGAPVLLIVAAFLVMLHTRSLHGDSTRNRASSSGPLVARPVPPANDKPTSREVAPRLQGATSMSDPKPTPTAELTAVSLPALDVPALDVPVLDPPAPERVTVESGPLDAKALAHRVERALRVFEDQCWVRYRVPIGPITKDPALRVEMTIDRSGRVRKIEASKSPQGYRGVGPCVIGRMRGWRFAKADDESRAVVIVERPSK